MRRPLIHAAALVAFLCSAVAAQAPPPKSDDDLSVRGVLIPPEPEALDPAEVAGLPKGSRPPVLTWERVYTLALVRSRGKEKPGLAEALDPKALAAQAERLGVADFARFRNEFLAAGTDKSGFHEPSPAAFDLLRRLQAVENARGDLVAHEQLMKVFAELARGESSGLTQSQVDQALSALQRVRLRFIAARTQYQDGLDLLKLDLGLAPHARVVADRESLAAFRAAFDAASNWFKDPNRRLEQLPRIAGSLPALEDVTINANLGLSLSRVVSGGDPAGLDGLLSTASRVAGLNRSEPGRLRAEQEPRMEADGEKESRLRRRLRRLYETSLAYEIERRNYVLFNRQKHQAFERIIAPPAAEVSPAPLQALNLIGFHNAVQACQDRLVSLWAAYQTERLALYRDLGTLPYSDWKSFYASLSPRPGKVAPAIKPGREASPAAPAPPAPPAPPARPRR